MAAPSGWGELCSKFGENGDFATDLPEFYRIIYWNSHISGYRLIFPDIPGSFCKRLEFMHCLTTYNAHPPLQKPNRTLLMWGKKREAIRPLTASGGYGRTPEPLTPT